MNLFEAGLALGGLLVAIGTWVQYMSTVPNGNVPAWPLGGIILQIAALVMVVAALITNVLNGGAGALLVWPPAFFAMMAAAGFLWLLSIRKTPQGTLKVAVGDRLLPFEALTSEGVAFHTDELAGKRILLKFFRGGW